MVGSEIQELSSRGGGLRSPSALVCIVYDPEFSQNLTNSAFGQS